MSVSTLFDRTGACLRPLVGWIDDRFPLSRTWREHLSEYYAPKNFNIWYYFGSLALLVLVIQIVTGIFLTMNYKPDATDPFLSRAFLSVEYIMRDVAGGWLIRYMHSTGASMFFAVVYLHMFRGLIYGSYHKPRELLWVFGSLIFLCLMAEAFLGYLLPWGQMSFWGAQVIVNLFSSLPFIGPDLSVWIRGDFVISDATLNRFFALHVIAVPLVLLGLIAAHILALHETGSSNPDGIEIKKNKNPQTGIPLDGIPFHPYYTVKDMLGAVVFLIIFFAIVFFLPSLGGYFLEDNNFFPANPVSTPPHIAPVWYFTPFYAILRAVPSFAGTQVWGVLAMGLSVVLIALLPWLDRSPIKSIRYRGTVFQIAVAIFLVAFIGLGILGAKPPTALRTYLAQVLSLIYFAFFFSMPFFSRIIINAPAVPARLTFSTLRQKILFFIYCAVTILGSWLFAEYV